MNLLAPVPIFSRPLVISPVKYVRLSIVELPIMCDGVAAGTDEFSAMQNFLADNPEAQTVCATPPLNPGHIF
jgi:hypothetical protein